MPARYLIGIDLGTTNSAVAYVDTEAADPRVRVFEVAQLVAPGEVTPRRQLPSFVYLAGEIDLAPHETSLPWRPVAKVERDPQAPVSTALRPVVGELARSQGARMASRMIASAKSWLCHPGVDRQAAILPWGESDGPKLSPVAAQALVLRHIREAWDFEHPDDPFEEQEVLVTVPASFDEAARELTLQASVSAGYPPVVLLEEPQAAFYAWIDAAHGGKGLAPGERVLVFDVGGGTTDLITCGTGITPGVTGTVVTVNGWSVRCLAWTGNVCTRPQAMMACTVCSAYTNCGVWHDITNFNNGDNRTSRNFCAIATGSETVVSSSTGGTAVAPQACGWSATNHPICTSTRATFKAPAVSNTMLGLNLEPSYCASGTMLFVECAW